MTGIRGKEKPDEDDIPMEIKGMAAKSEENPSILLSL